MSLIKIGYDKLPYQAEFHEATDPNVLLSTGYGGGKTYALVMKMFRLMNVNRGIPGGMLCPNLKMFRRDVLPTIKQICSEYSIPFHYRRQDQELIFKTTNSTILVFHSEDDGTSIKGPNLGFGLINEVTLCSRGAFDAFLSRMRIKNTPLPQIAMSGTPEGFNWVYDDFIAKQRSDTKIIFGDMRSNKFVLEGYADRLWETFDEKSREMYVKGKFVNLQGMAALHAFNRGAHCKPTKRDPNLPVWVAIDFNVNPMAASFWQPVPVNKGQKKLVGFGELCLRNADTAQLAQAIQESLGGTNNVVLYPDPAGKARSTKSHHTDIMILEDHGFTDIRFKSRIASVRDCINASNSLIDKGLVEVDPVTMPETIRDFEQVAWKDGVFELNKTDGKRTHWLDGFKNMIDFEFPVGEARGSWRESER